MSPNWESTGTFEPHACLVYWKPPPLLSKHFATKAWKPEWSNHHATAGTQFQLYSLSEACLYNSICPRLDWISQPNVTCTSKWQQHSQTALWIFLPSILPEGAVWCVTPIILRRTYPLCWIGICISLRLSWTYLHKSCLCAGCGVSQCYGHFEAKRLQV